MKKLPGDFPDSRLENKFKLIWLNKFQAGEECINIGFEVSIIIPVGDFVKLHTFNKSEFLLVVFLEFDIEGKYIFLISKDIFIIFELSDKIFKLIAELFKGGFKGFVNGLDLSDLNFHIIAVGKKPGVEFMKEGVDLMFFISDGFEYFVESFRWVVEIDEFPVHEKEEYLFYHLKLLCVMGFEESKVLLKQHLRLYLHVYSQQLIYL